MSVLSDAVDEVVAGGVVPGAIVGLYDDGQMEIAAAGMSDAVSRTPMTAATRFLFGSVTKVWVTTLVMTMVDAGLVDLDAPVNRYVPEFTVADDEATDAITVRMLLTHSSGIDAADLIVETGADHRAIERYVQLLADRQQLHAPGAFASYNNAGFVVAGRLLEIVTGQTFAAAMRDRLFEPLGLLHTELVGEERPADASIGHFPRDGGVMRSPRFLLPSALAPAGSTLLVSAADALAFGRLHLDDGKAKGRRVLTHDAAAAMTHHQLAWPAPQTGDLGLGWWREAGDELILSHGGGSLGGAALLVLVPRRNIAMVAYVNSTASPAALQYLRRAALGEELSAPMAGMSARPVDASVDPARFVGVFQRYGMTNEIVQSDDGLRLMIKPALDIVSDYMTGQPTSVPVRPISKGVLGLADSTEAAATSPLAWLVDHDYLYLGNRLARRRQ